MKRHPGRRGMARLLAGRMAFQSTEHEVKDGVRTRASHTYRNPDRAAMHPGKAAKKAARRDRVYYIRTGAAATMAVAHALQCPL